VIGLAEDIARSMGAAAVRAAVVPGRNAIGIELPNARREKVNLRQLLESEAFRTSDAGLPLVLGRDIAGAPVITDLARMPHLLVAGTTGAGKSVGVNAMILSLLYKLSPDQCRLLMIDPKMLELSVYNGIPHLLCQVVTEPDKAVAALNWAVAEMEQRYRRMSWLAVRNIDAFNARVRQAPRPSGGADPDSDLGPMPHIVVVVDEFADLMIVAGKEIESAVQRLAQMARAAGIHLIMATQRPSVDIITGTIKANFPTRISYKVASKFDSRTILNDQGAEQLLGQGDMLFSSGMGRTLRVHGPFVSDEEVEGVSAYLRDLGPPRYIDGVTDVREGEELADDGRRPAGSAEGDLYERAVAIVSRDRKASTSYLQRRLLVGYNRAADLMERMEREGVVSAADRRSQRQVLLARPGDADKGW
jgi:S-DNA-T family DNA segregation ATPase FtsK/SpoIIIE